MRRCYSRSEFKWERPLFVQGSTENVCTISLKSYLKANIVTVKQLLKNSPQWRAKKHTCKETTCNWSNGRDTHEGTNGPGPDSGESGCHLQK